MCMCDGTYVCLGLCMYFLVPDNALNIYEYVGEER